MGIIHINQPGQRVGGLSISHGLLSLVSHQLDRLIACDLQHSLKAAHGEAAFLLLQQVDHLETFRQGSSGLVKDGPYAGGDLIAASLELLQVEGTIKRSTFMVVPSPIF